MGNQANVDILRLADKKALRFNSIDIAPELRGTRFFDRLAKTRKVHSFEATKVQAGTK